jgi:hypothetical protein
MSAFEVISMKQDRRFNRVRPSGNVSRTASIIIDPKSPVIGCNVVDYSAGGACLELTPGKPLPNRFELLYAGSKKKCRLVWAKGPRVGVSF